LDTHRIQLVVDFKVIIEWLKYKNNLQTINIEGWKHRVQDLESSFQKTNFQHIFRTINEEVDKLSKGALEVPKRRLTYFSWDGENEDPPQCLKFF